MLRCPTIQLRSGTSRANRVLKKCPTSAATPIGKCTRAERRPGSGAPLGQPSGIPLRGGGTRQVERKAQHGGWCREERATNHPRFAPPAVASRLSPKHEDRTRTKHRTRQFGNRLQGFAFLMRRRVGGLYSLSGCSTSLFCCQTPGQRSWDLNILRSRLSNRVQLTTHGHRAYLEAVKGTFGGDR